MSKCIDEHLDGLFLQLFLTIACMCKMRLRQLSLYIDGIIELDYCLTHYQGCMSYCCPDCTNCVVH